MCFDLNASSLNNSTGRKETYLSLGHQIVNYTCSRGLTLLELSLRFSSNFLDHRFEVLVKSTSSPHDSISLSYCSPLYLGHCKILYEAVTHDVDFLFECSNRKGLLEEVESSFDPSKRSLRFVCKSELWTTTKSDCTSKYVINFVVGTIATEERSFE